MSKSIKSSRPNFTASSKGDKLSLFLKLRSIDPIWESICSKTDFLTPTNRLLKISLMVDRFWINYSTWSTCFVFFAPWRMNESEFSLNFSFDKLSEDMQFPSSSGELFYLIYQEMLSDLWELVSKVLFWIEFGSYLYFDIPVN